MTSQLKRNAARGGAGQGEEVGTPASGQGLRYRARKEAILAAASRLLARSGSEEFSVTAVAREMELHPVSLTYYFKRKEDIAAAVLRDTIARTSDLLTAAEQERTPQDALRTYISGYFEVRKKTLLEECAPLVRYGEIHLVDGPARLELEAAFAQLHQRLARVLKSPDMPWMTSERRQSLARLVTCVLSWSDPWLWQHAPKNFDRVAERLTDIMIEGLTAGDADWSLVQASSPGLRARRDTRERFLEVATRLINQEGYRNASVDRVSAEVNLTKGSFYHHLAGKDELLTACFERSFRLVSHAIESGQGAGAAWDDLAGVVSRLADLQLGGDGERLLRPTALTAGPSELRRRHLVEYLQMTNGLSDLITRGAADGSLRPIDQVLAAHYVQVVVTVLGSFRDMTCVIAPDGLREAFLRPALTGFFRP